MGSPSKAKIPKKINNSRTPQIGKTITAKVDTGKVRRKSKKRNVKPSGLSPQATLSRLKQSRYELIRELDSIREILKDDVYPSSSMNRLISGEILRKNPYSNSSTTTAPVPNDNRAWGVIFGRKMDIQERAPDMNSYGPQGLYETNSGGNKSKLNGTEGSIVNVQQFAEQFKNLCERFKKHAPPAELQFLELEQMRIQTMLTRAGVGQQHQQQQQQQRRTGPSIMKDRCRQNRQQVGAQTASLKNGLGRSDDLKSFKFLKTSKNPKDQPKSDLVPKTDANYKQCVQQKSKGIGKLKRAMVGSEVDSLTDGSTTESLYNYNRYAMKRDASLASMETTRSSLNTTNSEDSYTHKPQIRKIQRSQLTHSRLLRTSTSFAAVEEEEDGDYGITELSEAGSEEASVCDSGSEVTSDSSSSPQEITSRPQMQIERVSNLHAPKCPLHSTQHARNMRNVGEPKPLDKTKLRMRPTTSTRINANTVIGMSKKQVVKELKTELQNMKILKALTSGSKKVVKCFKAGKFLEPIEEESAEIMPSVKASKTNEIGVRKSSTKNEATTRRVRFVDDAAVEGTEMKPEKPNKGNGGNKVTLSQGDYKLYVCDNVLSDAAKKELLCNSVVKWTDISRDAADTALEHKKCEGSAEVEICTTPDILPGGDFEFNTVKFVEPFNYVTDVKPNIDIQSRESGDYELKKVEVVGFDEKNSTAAQAVNKIESTKSKTNCNGNEKTNENDQVVECEIKKSELSCVQSKSLLLNNEPEMCNSRECIEAMLSASQISIRKGYTESVSCGAVDESCGDTQAMSSEPDGLNAETEFSSQQVDDESHCTYSTVKEIEPIFKQAMEKLNKHEIELKNRNEVDTRTAFQKDVKDFALNSSNKTHNNKLNSHSIADEVKLAMSKSAPALRYDDSCSVTKSASKHGPDNFGYCGTVVDSKSSAAILPLDCEFFLPNSPTMEELAKFCRETLDSMDVEVNPTDCSEILEPVFDVSPLRSQISIETLRKRQREEMEREVRETEMKMKSAQEKETTVAAIVEKKAEIIQKIKSIEDTSISGGREHVVDVPTTGEVEKSSVDISNYTMSNGYEFVEDSVGHADADSTSSSAEEEEPYTPIDSGYAWQRLGLLEKSQIDSQQLLRNLEDSIENMKSGLLKLAKACERIHDKPPRHKRAKRLASHQQSLLKKAAKPIQPALPLKLEHKNRDLDINQFKATTMGMKNELEAFYKNLVSEQPNRGAKVHDDEPSTTFKLTENEASSALRLTGDIIARAYEERYGGNPSFDDIPAALRTAEKFDKCETEECDLGEAGKPIGRYRPMDVDNDAAEIMAPNDGTIPMKAPIMYMPLLCVPTSDVKPTAEPRQSSPVRTRPVNFEDVFKEKFGKFAADNYPAKLEPRLKSGYEYFCSKSKQELDLEKTTSETDSTLDREEESCESCQMILFENPYEKQETECSEKFAQLQHNAKDADADIPEYSGCPCMFSTYKDMINHYKSTNN